MARRKSILSLSGSTESGGQCVAGIQKMVGTIGLPLDLLIPVLLKKGIVIDWEDYIECALKEGHNPSTLRTNILVATRLSYPRAVMRKFEERLDLLITKQQ